MKRLVLIFFPAALALAQLSPRPAPKPVQNNARETALPSAQTILERSGEATGQAALKSIKTQKRVGKLSIPETGISGSVVIYNGERGERYQTMEIPGAGKTEAGNNGDVEWERSTLTGPKVLRVADEPGGLLEPDPLNLSQSNRFSKLETAGLDNVNGKPCFLVRQWLTSNDSMITVCYDRKTFLPVQLKTDAGEPALTMIFGDYRAVGPVTVPFLIETQSRGQTIRTQFETITLNEPLPREALELPEEIEKLAYQRLPPEIRELEVDRDRPILRHRPPPKKGLGKKQPKSP